MTYLLNIFLKDSSKKPLFFEGIQIVPAKKSMNFFLGMFSAVCFFFLLTGYRKRHLIRRFLCAFILYCNTSEKTVFGEENLEEAPCRAGIYLKDFLKKHQLEILTTVLKCLQIADIPLEVCLKSLETEKNLEEFQMLMNEISLMVMERAAVPEGEEKEKTLIEIRERYIPKLLEIIETLQMVLRR